ncbi:MAG: hypothetical protein U9Q29_00115 [Campylobacterota bacterium]|nr:hypothetical protein [Campylobacterota bacterium]
MKRAITLGVVSIISSLILVGCSGTSPSASESTSVTVRADAKHSGWTQINANITQEKLHTLIKTAGEKDGWKMTEFKSNAIIAEKTDGDDTTAVTISFDKHSFTTNPKNSDLEDVISDALADTTSSH